jgi:hypothetical protein
VLISGKVLLFSHSDPRLSAFISGKVFLGFPDYARFRAIPAICSAPPLPPFLRVSRFLVLVRSAVSAFISGKVFAFPDSGDYARFRAIPAIC